MRSQTWFNIAICFLALGAVAGSVSSILRNREVQALKKQVELQQVLIAADKFELITTANEEESDAELGQQMSDLIGSNKYEITDRLTGNMIQTARIIALWQTNGSLHIFKRK